MCKEKHLQRQPGSLTVSYINLIFHSAKMTVQILQIDLSTLIKIEQDLYFII